MAARYNNCPLCTYGPAVGDQRVEKKCPRGSYTASCPGTLYADNTCVQCDATPCFARSTLAITEFGYYRERCTDNFAYTPLQDTCVACNQACPVVGTEGGAGWWRPNCKTIDFAHEPPCHLCGFANNATQSNVCPGTQFLVKCENGKSERFVGTTVIKPYL